MTTPTDTVIVSVEVNGRPIVRTVAARVTLADFLRDDLGLTGTKLGCEHGVCGACTVLLDDQPARACLLLAAQTDGCRVRTVESLADGRHINSLQRSFQKHHALQCGFCTAGFLVSVTALLEETPHPDRDEIAETLSGHICRCTGYAPIIDAVAAAADGGES